MDYQFTIELEKDGRNWYAKTNGFKIEGRETSASEPTIPGTLRTLATLMENAAIQCAKRLLVEGPPQPEGGEG